MKEEQNRARDAGRSSRGTHTGKVSFDPSDSRSPFRSLTIGHPQAEAHALGVDEVLPLAVEEDGAEEVDCYLPLVMFDWFSLAAELLIACANFCQVFLQNASTSICKYQWAPLIKLMSVSRFRSSVSTLETLSRIVLNIKASVERQIIATSYLWTVSSIFIIMEILEWAIFINLSRNVVFLTK